MVKVKMIGISIAKCDKCGRWFAGRSKSIRNDALGTWYCPVCYERIMDKLDRIYEKARKESIKKQREGIRSIEDLVMGGAK